jgi:hypothetical protein
MEETTNTKIDTATIIVDENKKLEISPFLYCVGLIIMFISYVGPFFYYKYYKKKNFTAANNIGVKHAI